MRGFFSWSLLSFLSLASPALYAQEKAATASSAPKRAPIEIHFSTLGGLQYSIGDVPLAGYGDLEDLIKPLGDYEAMRLLKRSESSDLLSKILGGAGFLGLATGAVGILTSSSSDQRPFWITAVGSGILYNIAGLFRSESQTAKFNSVQRYNRFARGEEQTLPQTPEDEKSLLDFATPTPSPDKNGKTGKK